MKTPSAHSAALSGDLKQRNAGKIWPLILILIVLIFALLYWKLASAFETRLRFISLLPDQTLVVSGEMSFKEAKSVHISQAQRAARLFLGRGPRGLDDKNELARICTRAAFDKAIELLDEDAREFAEKAIYQKVVLRETALSKLQDSSVQAVVKGELIRVGNMNGKSITEGLNFELTMHFVENPSTFENGLYPTQVKTFDLFILSVPSS